MNEPAGPADEEPNGKEYLVGEVKTGESCIANEVLEDALSVELWCCENAEAVQVGTDDTFVMENCGVCDPLVNEQLDNVLDGIHGGEVDDHLGEL